MLAPDMSGNLSDLLRGIALDDLIDELEDESSDEEPPCGKVNVVFDRIRITGSQTPGFFGEPGPKAEWSVDIQVNGTVKNWYSDQVKDNTDFHLGHNFRVDLDDPSTSEIRVYVSGQEEDPSSPNEQLPVAQATHGPKDDYGIGKSFTTAGSKGPFKYTVEYRIECLYTQTSALSMDRATDTVRSMAESRTVSADGGQLREDDCLTTFLNVAANRGYELQGTDGKMLLFEGPGDVREVMEAFDGAES